MYEHLDNLKESELIKELKRSYKGPMMIECNKKGTVCIFWKHWKYSPWFLAPKVYIGGKFKFKQTKVYYLWLD